MKIITFLLGVCIIYTDCSSPQEDTILKTRQADYENINDIIIDSLFIPIDSLSNNYYPTSYNVYEAEGNLYYVAYNEQTHNLDWLCLTDSLNSFHTKLDSQGPDMVFRNNVEGLYIHNLDSIFLNDGFNLLIINHKGNVIQRKKNEFYLNSKESFRLYNYNTSNLFYNKKRKSIIGSIYFISNKVTSETPVLVEIFIKDWTFRFLNATYPQFYIHQKNFLSSDICLNTSYNQDSIIYNYSYNSNIYIYNLDNDIIHSFGGTSKLSQNKIERINKIDKEKRWIHWIENPRFFRVHYDPFKKIYYRLHWKEINYLNSENKYNTPYEKEIILSIYTHKFELLKEFILQPYTYLTCSEEVTSIGLIINSNNPKNITYEPEKYKIHKFLIKMH